MSRSRQPRINHSQDADEEKRLWSQIQFEAKRVDALIARCGSIGNEIVEIEKAQAALTGDGKPSDAAADEKLEALYRENVRLSEQIQHAIEGKSDDMNLLDHIRILAALREAADDTSPGTSTVRSASTSGGAKSRSALFAKRKAAAAGIGGAATGPTGIGGGNADEDGEDVSAVSVATSSPRTANGRLLAAGAPFTGRDKPTRGNSAAPSMREPSVKVEDTESIASSLDDNAKGPPSATSTNASVTPLHAGNGSGGTQTTSASASSQSGVPGGGHRLQLTLGAMVFYRNKRGAQEGEGILCRVSSVIGEGKQRRYEIQDADPDAGGAGGSDPPPYRASVSHLIPIPVSNTGLPDLPKGKNVLAQYPDTTTFYKAEVSTPWRAKDMIGDKGRHVRLRFEGEMEEAKETEVERRFVVPDVK